MTVLWKAASTGSSGAPLLAEKRLSLSWILGLLENNLDPVDYSGPIQGLRSRRDYPRGRIFQAGPRDAALSRTDAALNLSRGARPDAPPPRARVASYTGLYANNHESLDYRREEAERREAVTCVLAPKCEGTHYRSFSSTMTRAMTETTPRVIIPAKRIAVWKWLPWPIEATLRPGPQVSPRGRRLGREDGLETGGDR
ncbi:hypothetical protein KM043_005475 [Ampulex compressa]|nr:hypothetical protein KM043_005475 [Ampulex compressa]